MFKQLVDLVARVFSLSKDVQQNKADIKDMEQEAKDLRRDFSDLRKEVRDLSRAVERLAYEIHRVSENEAQERRILRLELENALLKSERHLPAPEQKNEP